MKAVTYVMDELNWDSPKMARLMAERGIKNRSALAKTLGLSRDTVNTAFDPQWKGRATAYLMAVMCSYFQVRMVDLVEEPLTQIRRLNSRHLQRLPHTEAAS